MSQVISCMNTEIRLCCSPVGCKNEESLTPGSYRSRLVLLICLLFTAAGDYCVKAGQQAKPGQGNGSLFIIHVLY